MNMHFIASSFCFHHHCSSYPLKLKLVYPSLRQCISFSNPLVYIIFRFIFLKFYLPQNTRKQIIQPKSLTLYNRIAFLPVSNNMLLIFIWYFVRMIFTVRISTNICSWPLRLSLRRLKISLQHSSSPEPIRESLLMSINNKLGFF